MPQELSLFHATVRENLTLGDTAVSDADISAALAQSGADDFVKAMPDGLATDVGETGRSCQAANASAFRSQCAGEEPQGPRAGRGDNALDPETEAAIVDNIAGLRGAYTIVAITHRPAWTRIADRLYRVADGQVTAEETQVAAL